MLCPACRIALGLCEDCLTLDLMLKTELAELRGKVIALQQRIRLLELEIADTDRPPGED